MTAQGKCPNCQADLVACPKCQRIVRNKALVAQTVVDGVGLTAVGFRCPNCGHEWGTDLPPRIAARVTMRRELAAAYHRRWCGTPLSCGDAPTCEGRIDDASLDEIMAVIPEVLRS